MRSASSGLVLSLCDRTGQMVQSWLEAGYDALTVDLQSASLSQPRRRHSISDVRCWTLGGLLPVAVFAFPPCTHALLCHPPHYIGAAMTRVMLTAAKDTTT